MVDEWREVRVGDLVNQGVLAISDGYRVRNEELGPEGIPFVRGGDIGDGWINTNTEDHIRPEFADRIRLKLSKPGDAAFITKGTVGRAGCLRPEQPPVVFAPQVAYWRVLDQTVLDPGFVFYFMRSHAFQSALDGVKTHGAMAADYVSISQQHDFRFRFPGIDSQRAIAHILGTLDHKIELNGRTNETLEAIGLAIFKSWFVDFDPVRAKSENRDPGLPKPIADLFPNRFEESELGEIPDGWSIGDIGNLVRLSRDGIDPSQFPDETFDHFSIPAFDEGRKPRTELGSSIKSNKLIVPPDVVLLSKLNPRIRRIWLPVIRDGHRAICSTEFLLTSPAPGMSREFIFSFLSSEAFSGVFETLVTGTSGSHQRVKPEGLLAMGAVIPVEPVIHQFTKVVRPLLARADCVRAESQTLSALRDALLSKLISGEIRVEHAERMVEKVL